MFIEIFVWMLSVWRPTSSLPADVCVEILWSDEYDPPLIDECLLLYSFLNFKCHYQIASILTDGLETGNFFFRGPARVLNMSDNMVTGYEKAVLRKLFTMSETYNCLKEFATLAQKHLIKKLMAITLYLQMIIFCLHLL